MRLRHRYAASIVAAVIPLAIALTLTWALYVYAGIGKPRALYDVLRSNENLYQSVIASDKETSESHDTYEPKWQGTADEPLTVVFIGTSPTMHGVIPTSANEMEEDLNLRVYNMGRSNWHYYNYYDYVKVIDSLADVDIFVMEYNFALTSDHRLAFKYKQDSWKAVVYDDRIYDTIRALKKVWSSQDSGPRVPSTEGFDWTYEKTKTLWQEVSANPDDARVKHYNHKAYRSAKNAWKRNRGITDIDTEDIDLIRTNHVALTTIERISDYCTENDIGLVIYVPSIAKELTEPSDDKPLWRASPVFKGGVTLRVRAVRHTSF